VPPDVFLDWLNGKSEEKNLTICITANESRIVAGKTACGVKPPFSFHEYGGGFLASLQKHEPLMRPFERNMEGEREIGTGLDRPCRELLIQADRFEIPASDPLKELLPRFEGMMMKQGIPNAGSTADRMVNIREEPAIVDFMRSAPVWSWLMKSPG